MRAKPCPIQVSARPALGGIGMRAAAAKGIATRSLASAHDFIPRAARQELAERPPCGARPQLTWTSIPCEAPRRPSPPAFPRCAQCAGRCLPTPSSVRWRAVSVSKALSLRSKAAWIARSRFSASLSNACWRSAASRSTRSVISRVSRSLLSALLSNACRRSAASRSMRSVISRVSRSLLSALLSNACWRSAASRSMRSVISRVSRSLLSALLSNACWRSAASRSMRSVISRVSRSLLSVSLSIRSKSIWKSRRCPTSHLYASVASSAKKAIRTPRARTSAGAHSNIASTLQHWFVGRHPRPPAPSCIRHGDRGGACHHRLPDRGRNSIQASPFQPRGFDRLLRLRSVTFGANRCPCQLPQPARRLPARIAVLHGV